MIKHSTGEMTDVDITGGEQAVARAKQLIEEVVRRVQHSETARAAPSSGSRPQEIKIARTDPINKNNIEKELWFMFEDLDIKEARQ